MKTFNLCVAVGYTFYIVGIVASKVGTMTGPPTLYEWHDVITFPFLACIFPMLLGYSIKK